MKSNLFGFLSACFLLVHVSVATAQVPSVAFSKLYGGAGGEIVNHASPTPDGGYVMIGATSSAPGTGDVSQRIASKEADVWLVKTDSAGTLEWEGVFGGSDATDDGKYIIPTRDGGYIFVASAQSTNQDISYPIGHRDIWVVKLDKSFNIQWDTSFGGVDQDEAVLVKQTQDDGFIIMGNINTYFSAPAYGHGGNDIILVKLDKNGKFQWEKLYGSTESDEGHNLILTSDGGFLLGGTARKDDGDVATPLYYGDKFGGGDAWVLKLNATGAIEWSHTYGGNGHDVATALAEAPDGNFLLAAKTRSNDGQVRCTYPPANIYVDGIWILKVNKSNGDTLWTRATYGNSASTNEPFAIEVMRDGGYIVAGQTQSGPQEPGHFQGNGNAPDGLLVKLDSVGQIEWWRKVGGTDQDMLFFVNVLPDGSIVTGGECRSQDQDITVPHPSGAEKFWLIKFAAPDLEKIEVRTAGNVPAEITARSGTLQLEARILPAVLPQNVTWSIIAGSGNASIDTTGKVTAVADGTVWAKAAATANTAMADSIEILISGQDGMSVALTDAKADWTVYPNPASEALHIHLSGTHPPLKLTVFTTEGKVLRLVGIAENQLQNGYELSLEGIAAGTYILRLDGGSSFVSHQIFVVN